MSNDSTTLLCTGYTTAGFLSVGGSDFVKVSMTSYSASFRKTIIQSQAMFKQASSVNIVSRTKNPYFQDVPICSCEISFDPEFSLLDKIIQFLISNRSGIIKTKLTDSASGIEWIFDECYLQSFSFDVRPDSILSVNLSLFVQPNSMLYNINKREPLAKGYDDILPIKDPIPYYAWSLFSGIEETELKDVHEFSFSFTQQVAPKYGCTGKQDTKAPLASKIVFGLPSMEFSYTQIIHDPQSIDFVEDQDGTFHKQDSDLENNSMQIKTMNNNLCKLTGLSVVEIAPTFDGIPLIRKTYSVNGTIKA